MLVGEAEAITCKAIELAKNGDLAAIRLCLDRIAPPRKDPPVLFALPALSKAEDAAKGFAAIAAAVASGELTPNEAGERPLIEIDHYGQRFIGCIECNRGVFAGASGSSWSCRRKSLRRFVGLRSGERLPDDTRKFCGSVGGHSVAQSRQLIV